jgi:hypothetical protein
MTHYHKERDAFEEYQKRCTRNMPPETPPIKTNTIGTDKVIDYAENAPAPPHWNMPLGTNPTTGKHYMNKYQRKLTSPIIKEVDWKVEVIIDVYDVLDAYPSGCPPIDHALKKLLCTGSRGAKDWETDLQEAIDSLERAKSFPPLPF